MAFHTVCTMLLLLLTIHLSSVLPYTINPLYHFYNAYAPYLVPSVQNPLLLPFNNDLLDTRIHATFYPSAPPAPMMNVLAEAPYQVSNKFTVVPLMLMSQNEMNTVPDVKIVSVSRTKPMMTVKTKKDNLMQCTPAVKIELEKPIVVHSLKTSIVFPSEIEIVHKSYKIPVKVGAVMAPVSPDTYVSINTPVTVKLVYAIPTEPVSVDYINNEDATQVPETESIIVNSNDCDKRTEQPPKNVTVLDFPEKEAEPNVQTGSEDDELVNRNPPQVLAPAGIVQSTQPLAIVQPFHNSKESAVLISLREESKKKRL